MNKSIRMIAALDAKRGIARNGETPWHLPGDLLRFKELTMGGIVIMGRKTFEAIGKPLEGRRNIVLSRNPDYQADGVEVMHDLQDALNIEAPVLWVIGGADIYKQALEQAETLELTKVDGDYGCDRAFPPYETEFILTNSTLPRHENNMTYVFSTYTRK